MTDAFEPLRSSAQPEAEPCPYLLVLVGEEQYALPGDAVVEVTRWRAPTPVPGAPPVLPGIVSQRGSVLPVIDLRLVMGLAAAPPARASRLVMVQHQHVALALLVDGVIDLIPLALETLAQPPAALDPARARLLAAVARYNDAPLAVLNLGALLAVLHEGLV